MAYVDTSPLENWADPATLSQVASETYGSVETFQTVTEDFVTNFYSTSMAYTGPGAAEFSSTAGHVRAFGEGCRALAALTEKALHKFAADLTGIEEKRERARAFADSYNCGQVARRYYYYWVPRDMNSGPTPFDGPPTGVILAPEPPDNSVVPPQALWFELSEWIPACTSPETPEGHRLLRDDGGLRVQADVEAAISESRAEYDRAVEGAVSALGAVTIDSSEFRLEVSSSDSFWDNPFGGIIGAGDDVRDKATNPPDVERRGSSPGGFNKPKVPGALFWIELFFVAVDEYQDARTRVEVLHPEWSDGEKQGRVIWETIVHIGTAMGSSIWDALGASANPGGIGKSGAGLDDDKIADFILYGP